MSDPNTVLVAIADELRALADARATPPEALARIRALAARHAARVELVYERDAGDATYHFDALLEEPAGTITLRFCPDRGQPFLLRGAERLSDRDLVRVDGETLTVADAIPQLDFIWRDRPIMKRLVDACLVQAALRADPVELTDEAVQAALDRIRIANGLHGAAETRAWMAERGLTHARLEAYAAEQAAILGLRDRIAGAAAVAAHFAAHRDDYDAATLDDATAELVAADLFEAWLAERRAAATIEWSWGSVEQTRRAGEPDQG